MSVRPSVLRYFVSGCINGFSPNLVCVLIFVEIWFGLPMGKFRYILTEISVRDIFSFPDDSLSKCYGILTLLGTCINIKEISFAIANWQIKSIFDSHLPATR